MSTYFDYSLEPHRAILFEDVKSNYASIECVERGLEPLTTSLCVMSHAPNSNGLILASSPKFKEVFGMKNVSRASDLPFLIDSKKFNYRLWYQKNTDIHGQRKEPTIQHVAFIESWAKRTKIVPPQMQLYIQYKIDITELLTKYTSLDEIHSYSIDESFLDVTESLNLFFPEIQDKYEQMDQMAKLIQKDILKHFGLYVTVGMGDNPLLAKIAMDVYAKHNSNMRSLIRYEDVPEKLWTIPNLTDFWGIGKKTAKTFNKMGIHTIKELANANPNLIKQKMGVIGLQHFFHANGIDESRVTEKYTPKSSSYSNSQILPRDYSKKSDIILIIKEMTDTLATRLRKNGKNVSNVSLYIGQSYQSNKSSFRASGNIDTTQSTSEIQQALLRLFDEKYKGGPVRQIGISFNKIADNNYKQLSLFDSVDDTKANEKKEKLQKVIDEIREEFDFLAIQKASSLTKASQAANRTKLIGGHASSTPEEDIKEKKNDR